MDILYVHRDHPLTPLIQTLYDGETTDTDNNPDNKKEEKKKKNHYTKEIRRGSFERVVQLPHTVEQEKVTAEYKNGVLKIKMPKKERSPDKKVKVEVK